MTEVLIVDQSKERRQQLADACEALGASATTAEDAFSAMNALGKAKYDVLVAHAGKRHLSLRGLMQLAKRKNHSVVLLVLADEADEATVKRAMGADVMLMVASLPPSEIARAAVPERTFEPEPEPLPNPLPESAPTPPEGFEGPPVAGAWEAGTGNHAITAEGAAVEEAAPTGDERAGAEALMDSFARELTGALRVSEGDVSWTLFLYSGEPAWVHPPGGDAIVFESLVAARVLPPDAKPEPVPEGQLLGALVAAGAVDGDAAGDVMRQVVQQQTLALASAGSPEIDVIEQSAYLASPPPFRLNPFGMLLEARKQSMTPDAVLAEGNSLRSARLSARAGLAGVSGKLAPFVRGVDITDLLTGEPTLDEFGTASGLDPMMSTLFALSLRDAGLLEIMPSAPEAPDEPAAVPLPSSSSAGPLPEASSSAIGELVTAIEEAVLPNEVLGIKADADAAAIDAAFEDRSQALSPDTMPPDLAPRATVAREKLERAVRTMRATAI